MLEYHFLYAEPWLSLILIGADVAANVRIRIVSRDFFHIFYMLRLLQKRLISDGCIKDGKHVVTMIPGDGIGPEISRSVKQIFAANNVLFFN